MDAVRIVRDYETIKVLADLVRKEILRLLAVQPLTETQLAGKLVLKKSSMAHHLTVLYKAGLIDVTRTKIDSYGILEKYYEATAKLFVVDWEAVPLELQRYFLDGHMERLRGMLSAFKLIAERHGKKVETTSEQLRELAYEVAKQMPTIAEKYGRMEKTTDREMLLIEIYSQSLKTVMNEPKWRLLFTDIEDSAGCA